MATESNLVENIRSASRQLVRELGFMGGNFAGTELPPSAVHALIEIDARPGITARDLAQLLRLEKSTVSRMLRKLILSGDIREETNEADSRAKELFLSETGRQLIADIHTFGRNQVTAALQHLAPGQRHIVVDGLRLYCCALDARTENRVSPGHIEIATGYRPRLIARITEMHALYYALISGFGQRFESVVASGLAAFCDRLGNPRNAIWAAVQGEEIVGSVAIDGEDLGGDKAHLRWFIVDDNMRSSGTGRKLLSAALAFVDANAFTETHLWTFSGLTAARHLYETYGFTCIEERPGNQWGTEVLEQHFVRPRP